MGKYFLNYASIDEDGSLYCECIGVFEDEASAINERNTYIKGDKKEYERDEYAEDDDYDSHVVSNTNILYEWSNGYMTRQYRIQLVLD